MTSMVDHVAAAVKAYARAKFGAMFTMYVNDAAIREIVCVALANMREPTKEMGGDPVVWRHMIDEALKHAGPTV